MIEDTPIEYGINDSEDKSTYNLYLKILFLYILTTSEKEKLTIFKKINLYNEYIHEMLVEDEMPPYIKQVVDPLFTKIFELFDF